MKPRLSILGAGLLGRTISRLLSDANAVHIGQVLNQSTASAHAAIDFIGAGEAAASIDALDAADIWLIATPDDQIASRCEALIAHGKLRPGDIVFHCSGSQTSALLDSARVHGAGVASIHPIRSFARPAEVVKNFAGTGCGTEGDAEALAVLVPLFEAIGAECIPILAEHKTLYHSAAVFACNYLVTLQDIAQAAMGQAGIARETAARLLEPLVRGGIEDIFRAGPAAALTGPASRGDWKTVERQQVAVSAWDPRYGQLYGLFAEFSKDLAERKKKELE